MVHYIRTSFCDKTALRHILIEAAWIAIQKYASLMDVYQRIAKTRGAKRAIVGVARRLAGRLRSCIQRGVMYENQNSHSS